MLSFAVKIRAIEIQYIVLSILTLEGRKKKKTNPRAALTRDIRVAFVLTVYEYWSEGALQVM